MVEVAGREVKVTNPDKVYFPARADEARPRPLLLRVGDLTLSGIRLRPSNRQTDVWTASMASRSSRSACPTAARLAVDGDGVLPERSDGEELCPTDVAHVAWAVNLGCIELHPWPSDASISTIPTSSASTSIPNPTSRGTRCARWPAACATCSTSTASWAAPRPRQPRHPRPRARRGQRDFEVRRAVLALAREVERRLPDIATTAWWKRTGSRRLSSTTTRTPATARWPRRIRPCVPNARGLRPLPLGRPRLDVSRRPSPCAPCRAGWRPSAATRTRPSTIAPAT